MYQRDAVDPYTRRTGGLGVPPLDAVSIALDDATAATAPAGSLSFTDLTAGTNYSTAMVVGDGASLGVSGTGTIDATSVLGYSAGDYPRRNNPETITGLWQFDEIDFVDGHDGLKFLSQHSFVETAWTFRALTGTLYIDSDDAGVHGISIDTAGTGTAFYVNGSISGSAQLQAGTFLGLTRQSVAPASASPASRVWSHSVAGVTELYVKNDSTSVRITNSGRLDDATTLMGHALSEFVLISAGAALPTADAAHYQQFFNLQQGAAGDILHVCIKKDATNYVWQPVAYGAP